MVERGWKGHGVRAEGPERRGWYEGNKAFGVVDGAIYHVMVSLLVCSPICCIYCILCFYLHDDGSHKVSSSRRVTDSA